MPTSDNDFKDFWVGPGLPNDLPRAYSGCTCFCHRHPNVWHCVPCCWPGKKSIFDIDSSEKIDDVNELDILLIPKSDQNLV
jgi:hypothetical protein